MKTLSRPMFNMGGPIKQGVMHGIREPYVKGKIVSGITSRAGPILKKAGDFFKGRTKGWLPSRPQIQIGTEIERIKGIAKPNPWGILGKTGPDSYKAGKPIMGPLPFKGNKLEYLKRFAKENPYWATGAGAATLTAPNLIYKTAPSIAGGVGKTLAGYVDAVLPGDQSKWFTPEKIAKDLTPIEGGATGAGGAGTATEDTSTAESRAAFAKSQRDKRVQKYLDLMGYDRTKKTAIADALIDASKIVSDRGTLDPKNITAELINPVIQATSKRLDKPEQIREAVGLMMTKAGLEKEMYDAKPGTQLKAAQDYVSQFGGSMDNAYKQLGLTKKGNFTESLATLAKQYGKGSDNQQVIIENIKFQKANEPGFDVEKIKVLDTGNISGSEWLEKAKKEEDFISVTDTILRHPGAHKEVDGKLIPIPGIYLIGSVVVEVDDTGNFKRIN